MQISNDNINIQQYLSSFLYYTLLFADKEHVAANYSKKVELANIMMSAEIKGKLRSIDEEFFDIISDMDIELLKNKPETKLFYSHREFVEKYLPITSKPDIPSKIFNKLN